MPDPYDFPTSLSSKSIKKAADELNEKPKEVQSHIDTLREWVQSQPHITSRTDDAFLLRFLRVAKFSQLRAQEVLENFCTVRSIEEKGAPEWFKDLDPSTDKMQEMLDLGLNVPLPGKDKQGRTVMLVQTGGYDPSKHDFVDVMRVGFMSSDVILLDPETQVNGLVVLLDFSEFSAAHVYNYTRSTIQKAMKCWTDTYPTRSKGVNYYNTPSVFNALQDVFMFFMKEKLKKRLHFHKDSLASLQQQVPRRMLPKEYGGDAGPLKDLAQAWKQKILDNRDEILSNHICKVDETLRPADAQSDQYGVTGSFRKLAVD